MKEVNIYRQVDNGTEALGELKYIRPNNSQFSCLTLERPWKDNKPDISCIPKGKYQCVYNHSEHLSALAGHNIFTYEIRSVSGRGGIRIHSANYYSQLEGCIALGKSYNTIGSITSILDSRVAIEAFEAEMNKEEFTLIIS